MADLSSSVGEISAVIRTMFGLTPRNRMRDQIRELVDLFKQMNEIDALSGAAANVAKVIDLQAAQLLDAHQGAKRKWNWSSLTVAWLLAGGCAWGCWALWPLQQWFWVVLFVALVIFGGLMIIAGVGTLLAKVDE